MIVIVGGVLMLAVDSNYKVTRVAGISLVYFSYVSYSIFCNWMNKCVSGTTKRIIVDAVLRIVYGVGNIIGLNSIHSNPTLIILR